MEYAHSLWNPRVTTLVSDLEGIQKRATKLAMGCNHLSYKERLKYLTLPTLKYRRIRGDMIEVFKIVNGLYDSQVVPNLPLQAGQRIVEILLS